jgi:hypothetical protein
LHPPITPLVYKDDGDVQAKMLRNAHNQASREKNGINIKVRQRTWERVRSTQVRIPRRTR